MKSKVTGLTITIAGIYYVLAEALCAIFFRDSLTNTYVFHTISELGIPGSNSPLYPLMNLAFILIGLALFYVNFTEFRDYIARNKTVFHILTIVTSLGVIIVGLIHGGNPLTSGYHTFGAVMAILGGNVLLVVISRSMCKFHKYQKITLLLGLIGLTAFWILFFNMQSIYMPVFERLSVYTLIIWSLYTGIKLYADKFEKK